MENKFEMYGHLLHYLLHHQLKFQLITGRGTGKSGIVKDY